jgi:hypothetical protein
LPLGLQLAQNFQHRLIAINVVMNHPPLAAFAAVNVGYPEICLNLVFHNQKIHMLDTCHVSKILTDANALITQFNPSVRANLCQILPRSADLVPANFGPPTGCIVETSGLRDHTSAIGVQSPFRVLFNAA